MQLQQITPKSDNTKGIINLVKSCGLLSSLTGEGWLGGGEAQARGNI